MRPPTRVHSKWPVASPASRTSKRGMQQRERRIERPMVGHRDAQHRGKDDRRMAEHHRKHESQRQRVQRGVVCRRTRRETACAEHHGAADREPHVARQQAHGDVAGEAARLARCAARGPACRATPRARAGRQRRRRAPRTRAPTRPAPRRAEWPRTPASQSGEGGRKRDSSRRSPAIVRIGNASHQVTTACTSAPVAQSSVADGPAQRRRARA